MRGRLVVVVPSELVRLGGVEYDVSAVVECDEADLASAAAAAASGRGDVEYVHGIVVD